MNRDFDSRRVLLALLFLVGWGAIGSPVLACNVPVFRYALEHWRPDAYRAVLFHRGPLTAADQDRVTALQGDGVAMLVNLAIRTVDLDTSPKSEDLELSKGVQDAALPRLVVQYPAYLQLDQPVWSGGFGESELARLLDSPARRDLLQRLTAGQTAVWVMIESGDQDQDDAAAATLAAELPALKQTLKLPELTDSPEDAIQEGPPIRLEFSLLRVRRDDALEQGLIATLLGCEADLATLKQPIVYPVFGRTRALLPLVGPGISAREIRSSAAFLSGACSCQVKEQNPGFDLLVTADWKELLSWAKSPAFASGETPGVTGEAELVPIPSGSKPGPLPQTVTEKTAEPSVIVTPVTPQLPEPPRPVPTGNSRSSVIVVLCLFVAGLIWTLCRRSS